MGILIKVQNFFEFCTHFTPKLKKASFKEKITLSNAEELIKRIKVKFAPTN